MGPVALGEKLVVVFERFSERAREVVVFAQDEARALVHNYVGTEHILLGLLRVEQGVAARVLESLGVSLEQTREHLIRTVGPGEEVTSGQIPFSPRSKKVLELSLRESLRLRHNYIGTEHILLALVLENEGLAGHVLLDEFNVGPEAVRDAVLRLVPPGDADQSVESGLVRASGTASAGSRSEFIFEVRPDPRLRMLLRVAAGRALVDERSQFGLNDLIAVANERKSRGAEPDIQPPEPEQPDSSRPETREICTYRIGGDPIEIGLAGGHKSGGIGDPDPEPQNQDGMRSIRYDRPVHAVRAVVMTGAVAVLSFPLV